MRIKHLVNRDTHTSITNCRCGNTSDIIHKDPCETFTETTELVRVDTNQNPDIQGHEPTRVSPYMETSENVLNDYAPFSPNAQIFFSNMNHHINEIKKSVHRMEINYEQKRKSQAEARLNLSEWRSVALVLDRFFFVIYLLLITMSLVVLFPKPKSNILWSSENEGDLFDKVFFASSILIFHVLYYQWQYLVFTGLSDTLKHAFWLAQAK